MRAMVAGSVRDRDRMLADGTVDWYLDLDLRGVQPARLRAGRRDRRPWLRGGRGRGSRRSLAEGRAADHVAADAARPAVPTRPRSLVVVLLASVVMALLFLMTGLVNQFNREPFDATRAIGAEHVGARRRHERPVHVGGHAAGRRSSASSATTPAAWSSPGARSATAVRRRAATRSSSSAASRRPADDDGRRRHRRRAAGRRARTRSSSTRRPASTSATSCSSVRSRSRSSA